MESEFKAPFRVGRKLVRTVLDANSKEVVIFKKGLEYMAVFLCGKLNQKYYEQSQLLQINEKDYKTTIVNSVELNTK